MKKRIFNLALLTLIAMSANAQTEKPKVVDMGLSVQWATTNLGCGMPLQKDRNYYYRFGELTGRSGQAYQFSNYASLEGIEITGNPDYDPVTATYGKNWLVPTADMFRELVENCEITTHEDAVYYTKYYRFKSKITGNYIDLPVTGYFTSATATFGRSEDLAIYLTSTPAPDSGSGEMKPYILNNSSVEAAPSVAESFYSMIRPVYDINSNVAPESLAFEKDTYEVEVGDQFTISYTILPENVSDPTVTWKSGNTQLLSIDKNGQATALLPGTTTITATANNGISATCTVIITGEVSTPLVDMGLSVKWATYNLGATSELESGDFYRIGDLTPKSTDDFPLASVNLDDITIGGNPEYDVVTSIYGEKWRIPNQEMFNELIQNCEITKEDELNPETGGYIYYYVYTSKINGNSIKIPCTGYYEQTFGDWWDHYDTSSAMCLTSDVFVNKWREVLVYVLKDKEIRESKRDAEDCYYPIRPVYVVREIISPEALEFDSKKYDVKVGDEFDIICTVLPENASNKQLIWESSEPKCVTVDENGHAKAIAVGTAQITATTANGIEATCSVTVTTEPKDVEYVDMGTSVMWAKSNLGASVPSEIGNYYRYGGLIGWGGYTFTGAMREVEVDLCNDPRYDAATANLSINWHTPTAAELQELIDNCTIIDYTLDGVEGKQFISKTTGQKLFFPASGMKYVYSPYGTQNADMVYLLSSSYIPYKETENSFFDYLGNVLCDNELVSSDSNRGRVLYYNDFAFPIRPVYSRAVTVEKISFEKNEGMIEDRLTLSPSVFPANATCKNLAWECSDPSVMRISDNLGSSLRSVVAIRESDGECEITARAVDGSGVKAVFLVKEQTTSVEIIEIDLDKQYDVYDLCGRRLMTGQYYPDIRGNLSSGVYIVKDADGAAIKIRIRN